jgi:hypothetical protein
MTADSAVRHFGLNIEKILEGWETCHGIREIIANALDEQVLSKTKDVQITQDDDGSWHIRDFGRGLKYENLTQNENQEKLKNPNRVIGKFGVGLKDALATLDCHGIDVLLRSRFSDIKRLTTVQTEDGTWVKRQTEGDSEGVPLRDVWGGQTCSHAGLRTNWLRVAARPTTTTY